MVSANLSDCNILSGDFRNAKMEGVDLSESDLRRAFLRGADLSAANLKKANLRGADFDHAILVGTQLHGADISLAFNLTADQLNRAHLDSKTKLPEYLKIEWSSETDFKVLANPE